MNRRLDKTTCGEACRTLTSMYIVFRGVFRTLVNNFIYIMKPHMYI